MKEQVITDLIEKVAELHVEYLKTGEGYSLITHLSKIESRREVDWRALTAAEASVLAAVCKKILEELDKDD